MEKPVEQLVMLMEKPVEQLVVLMGKPVEQLVVLMGKLVEQLVAVVLLQRENQHKCKNNFKHKTDELFILWI
jgi:hypothetical protein